MIRKNNIILTQRSLFVFIAVFFAFIIIWPLNLWAHSRELAGVILAGVLLGIPLAITLLVLGVIGAVYLIKRRSRPGYALFLITGPSITSAVYLLAFAFKPCSEFMGYLTVYIPALFFTVCNVIIGIFLRIRSSRQ